MFRKQSLAESIRLLDSHHTQLLLAALGEGQKAKDAFIQWRQTFVLDEIDSSSYRMLSQLLDSARRHGIEEQELPRFRGATKHTWLINQYRTQALSMALQGLKKSNIPSLLLKGGALFARYPGLISLRESADYDVLVKRSDAERTIALFCDLGLRTDGLRAEKYTKRDLDNTHGAHFIGKDHNGVVDLHWRPLPSLDNSDYINDLFARAETANFAGTQVRIPSLADQLFLTIARIELWDVSEQFSRVVEAAHILRYSRGQLDWSLFVQLVHRYNVTPVAIATLRILQNELGIEIPSFVNERLKKYAPGPFGRMELKFKGIPPYRRTARQQSAVKMMDIVKKRPQAFQCLRQPQLAVDFMKALVPASLDTLTGGKSLGAVWRQYAKEMHAFGSQAPDYVFGFSLPENIGRWTDGKFAAFTVPVAAEIGTTIHVKMLIIPVEPLDGSRIFHFKVCADPNEIHSIALECPPRFEPVASIIPAKVIDAKSPRALVALELTDANAPIVTGRTQDMRVLGLMFCGAEIIR